MFNIINKCQSCGLLCEIWYQSEAYYYNPFTKQHYKTEGDVLCEDCNTQVEILEKLYVE